MGFKLQNASEEDSSDSDQNNEKNLGSSSSSSSERYVKLFKFLCSIVWMIPVIKLDVDFNV